MVITFFNVTVSNFERYFLYYKLFKAHFLCVVYFSVAAISSSYIIRRHKHTTYTMGKFSVFQLIGRLDRSIELTFIYRRAYDVEFATSYQS